MTAARHAKRSASRLARKLAGRRVVLTKAAATRAPASLERKPARPADKKARHSRPLPYKGRGAAESWWSGRAHGASSSTARQRKPHRVHISSALDAGGGRRGLAAQPGPTGGAGGAQVAARTTGGGAMIRSTAAAALLLLLCGLALSAPSAAGARADPPPEASEDAAHAAEELRVGAASLAAVPPESRALFARVLGRLDGLRGEVEELRADKLELEERAVRLGVRVSKLEAKGCEGTREKEVEPEVEPEERLAPRTREATNSAHRRAQGAPQACVRVQDFQALSAAAMDACCPANGGGHRRLQASCGLPAACPSAACAAVFVPYMRD